MPHAVAGLLEGLRQRGEHTQLKIKTCSVSTSCQRRKHPACSLPKVLMQMSKRALGVFCGKTASKQIVKTKRTSGTHELSCSRCTAHRARSSRPPLWMSTCTACQCGELLDASGAQSVASKPAASSGAAEGGTLPRGVALPLRQRAGGAASTWAAAAVVVLPKPEAKGGDSAQQRL
jgi:hypothetical protein